MLEVDLQPLREFEPRLLGAQDWEVVLGLSQRGAQALLTCDDSMLSVARVVAVIEQTLFTVVTCRRVGHDPVVASGLLLAHLPSIGRRHDPARPQIWRLSAPEQPVLKIGQLKDEIEKRSGVRVDDYKLLAGAAPSSLAKKRTQGSTSRAAPSARRCSSLGCHIPRSITHVPACHADPLGDVLDRQARVDAVLPS
ncbi:MAG TPA: hypothetical protein VGR41_02805 [Actinomycetota bacterium]|nr:hypothetical protein [Actinomycetota bacterium]